VELFADAGKGEVGRLEESGGCRRTGRRAGKGAGAGAGREGGSERATASSPARKLPRGGSEWSVGSVRTGEPTAAPAGRRK
jgi:hypothetical protein